MNAKQARYLHQMLDRLAEGKSLSPEEIKLLRKALPELPKQKTLEEIAWDIDFAWAETSGNDWKEELFGDLETWLSEQYTQLQGLAESHPKFLKTEEDYENAPEGTVVAGDDQFLVLKPTHNWYINNDKFDNREMAGVRRRVLLWGQSE